MGFYLLVQGWKKCRLVDNIGARLGLRSLFSEPENENLKLKTKFIFKIRINIKEKCTIIAINNSGKTQELFAQLIQNDGG